MVSGKMEQFNGIRKTQHQSAEGHGAAHPAYCRKRQLFVEQRSIREALRLWEHQELERSDRLATIRAGIDEAAESRDRITDEELDRHFRFRHAGAISKNIP